MLPTGQPTNLPDNPVACLPVCLSACETLATCAGQRKRNPTRAATAKPLSYRDPNPEDYDSDGSVRPPQRRRLAVTAARGEEEYSDDGLSGGSSSDGGSSDGGSSDEGAGHRGSPSAAPRTRLPTAVMPAAAATSAAGRAQGVAVMIPPMQVVVVVVVAVVAVVVVVVVAGGICACCRVWLVRWRCVCVQCCVGRCELRSRVMFAFRLWPLQRVTWQFRPSVCWQLHFSPTSCRYVDPLPRLLQLVGPRPPPSRGLVRPNVFVSPVPMAPPGGWLAGVPFSTVKHRPRGPPQLMMRAPTLDPSGAPPSPTTKVQPWVAVGVGADAAVA